MLVLLLTSALQAKETKIPELKMTDIHGKTLKVQGIKDGLLFKGLEGKVVFLEFFGHNCPPCLASIPHLIKLQKKYKDRLAIVAIEVQGLHNTQLANFAKKRGINYTVIAGEKSSVMVPYIRKRANWKGLIPYYLIVDTEAKVRYLQEGMIPEDVLEKIILDLSSKKVEKKSIKK